MAEGSTAPPRFAGLTFERVLAAGAHSDVFQYAREGSSRSVAVRVLHERAADRAARRRVEDRADVLLALSAHASIVEISRAGLTETGHPYLVMEYCSLPTLAERCAARPLSVTETLRTMIALSGAVESAHRAGVRHGELTAANVLTRDDGRPVLSGFALTGDARADDDPRADVRGLAATAYTALTGTPPLGASPPLERDDVPETLRRLLTVSLSQNPADRPPTASDFADALGRIERSLDLRPTAFVVHDPHGSGSTAADAADDDHTVLSARSARGDDDGKTRLSSRGRPGADPAASAPPMEDATVRATRTPRGPVVRGHDGPPASGRVAYSPSADGVPVTTYGIRHDSAPDAVVRSAPSESAAPTEPAATAAAAAARARRTRLRLRVVVIGAVTVAVLTAAVAALLLLVGS